MTEEKKVTPEKEIPKEDKKEEKADRKLEKKFSALEEEMKKLQEELKKTKADADEWKNKYYMAFADMANLRKQNEKTYAEALKYRSFGFVEKLIPALDSFHIALTMGNPTPEVRNYLVGFEYIYRQLTNVLDEEGVKEIDPKLGSDFDLVTMHAVEALETDGPPNKIVKVMAKGYQLKDRIVRSAMVIVSKAKVAPVEPSKTEEKPVSEPTEKKEESSARKDA